MEFSIRADLQAHLRTQLQAHLWDNLWARLQAHSKCKMMLPHINVCCDLDAVFLIMEKHVVEDNILFTNSSAGITSHHV